MTVSPGPYTDNNQYRIRPSNKQKGKWHVQWRSNSICYLFFNGLGWETDYNFDRTEHYSFNTLIEYDTELEAEIRIKQLMDNDKENLLKEEKKREKEQSVKEWYKSKKPRRVPPFIHLKSKEIKK